MIAVPYIPNLHLNVLVLHTFDVKSNGWDGINVLIQPEFV